MKAKQTKAKSYNATKLDPKRRKALKRRGKLAMRDVKFAKKTAKFINKLMIKALAEFKTMQEQNQTIHNEHTHNENCNHNQELAVELTSKE